MVQLQELLFHAVHLLHYFCEFAGGQGHLNYFLDGNYKSRQGDNHFSGRGEGAASGVGRVEEKVYGV